MYFQWLPILIGCPPSVPVHIKRLSSSIQWTLISGCLLRQASSVSGPQVSGSATTSGPPFIKISWDLIINLQRGARCSTQASIYVMNSKSSEGRGGGRAVNIVWPCAGRFTPRGFKGDQLGSRGTEAADRRSNQAEDKGQTDLRYLLANHVEGNIQLSLAANTKWASALPRVGPVTCTTTAVLLRVQLRAWSDIADIVRVSKLKRTKLSSQHTTILLVKHRVPNVFDMFCLNGWLLGESGL